MSEIPCLHSIEDLTKQDIEIFEYLYNSQSQWQVSTHPLTGELLKKPTLGIPVFFLKEKFKMNLVDIIKSMERLSNTCIRSLRTLDKKDLLPFSHPILLLRYVIQKNMLYIEYDPNIWIVANTLVNQNEFKKEV